MDAITWSSGTLLTLNAAGSINVNANITATSGSFSAIAGNQVNVDGVSIVTSGGNITLNASVASGSGVRLNGASLNVGTGTG